MHWCFTKRIIPTNACESKWIYYVEIIVNLLRASVTDCGHLRFFLTWICYKDKLTVISLFDMSAFMVLWLLVVILMLLGVRWFDLHSLLKQIVAFVLFGCPCYIPFIQTFPRRWTQKATETCRRILQQLQCKKFMFFSYVLVWFILKVIMNYI